MASTSEVQIVNYEKHLLEGDIESVNKEILASYGTKWLIIRLLLHTWGKLRTINKK